jgi:hypothetical protein
METGNLGKWEVEGWGALDCTIDLGVERLSQDLKEGTLDEVPYSGERELVKSTSSKMTGHQVEGWG